MRVAERIGFHLDTLAPCRTLAYYAYSFAAARAIVADLVVVTASLRHRGGRVVALSARRGLDIRAGLVSNGRGRHQ